VPVTYIQYITYRARAKIKVPNRIQNEKYKIKRNLGEENRGGGEGREKKRTKQ